jgi:hypothetical protein
MNTTLLSVSLVLVSAAWACSSSDGDNDASGGAGTSGSDGGSGAAASGGSGGSGGSEDECPAAAYTCGESCGVIDGYTIDAARGCYERRLRLGCLPPDTVETDDMSCVKDANSGDTYQLTSGTHAERLLESDDYEACSSEEMSVAVDAEECVGVGIDAECPNDRESCPEGCTAFEGRLYDGDNTCLEAPIQLGCIPEGVTLSRNGSCIRDDDTGEVFILESATYSNQLLVEPHYRACALNDTMGSGEAGDCP